MSDTVRRHRLTNEELDAFVKNGFIGPITLYDPEEMEALWNSVRRQLPDRSKAIYPTDAIGGVTNISNYDRHLDISLLGEHICRPEIVDRVVSILGEDVLCWRTEFFPKYPGDEGTDWHQADTFANASGRPQILWPGESRENFTGGTITVWTAFTDATKENGCLQLMPGTHRRMNYDETKGMRFDPDLINKQEKEGQRRGFFGYDYRQLQIDPTWTPDETQAYPVVMKRGQCLIFWSTLMHASLPNVTKKDYRMGFVARYVPTSVHIYPDTEFVEEYGGAIPLTNYKAVLVSGADKHNISRVMEARRLFEEAPRP